MVHLLLKPSLDNFVYYFASDIKKVIVYCHPAYLTYMQSYIMRNAGLEEAQTGLKIARRNINNLRYADDTTLKAESEEELLDESERGE